MVHQDRSDQVVEHMASLGFYAPFSAAQWTGRPVMNSESVEFGVPHLLGAGLGCPWVPKMAVPNLMTVMTHPDSMAQNQRPETHGNTNASKVTGTMANRG